MLQKATNQLIPPVARNCPSFIITHLGNHSVLGKQKWSPTYFQKEKQNNKRTDRQMQKC